MLEIILGVLYVISIAFTYNAIRKYHIAKGFLPTGIDIIYMFFPIVNVMVALYLLGETPNGKGESMGERVFRINRGGGDDD